VAHTHQNDWFQVIICMQRETKATGNERFHSQYAKGKMHIPSFQPFIRTPHTLNKGLVGPRAGSGHFGGKRHPLHLANPQPSHYTNYIMKIKYKITYISAQFARHLIFIWCTSLAASSTLRLLIHINTTAKYKCNLTLQSNL
jgi:hypothetical protein